MDSMFSDLLTTDGLTPMTLEEFHSKPHSKPYLNEVAFTPSADKMRTQEDDFPIEIDLEPKVMDAAAKDRLHMSMQEFDDVFIRTMDYIREVENISYQNLQRGAMSIEEMDTMIIDYFHRNCPEVRHENDEARLLRRLNTALSGYYVLQALIDHPDTTDIKVCGYNDIRVRIKGKAYSSKAHFIDNRDLFMFINGICIRNQVGFNNSAIITFEDAHDRHYLLRFTISSPEVNAVEFPYMHIRKTAKEKPDWDELINRDMLTENIKNFLINCAKYSRCVVFAGPPGSGKSTALNAFIEYIPKTRESLVIQENDELFTNQPGFMFKHVTHGFDGGRIYTLEDLARMALVEGCNEFIVGEVKGGEMRNVMTLLNSGGYGALTVHANNAYEVMDKLADLVKYGSTYSFEEARRMLRSVDTVVYMEGYKIRQILACKGYDDESKQFIYENLYEYNFQENNTDVKEISDEENQND